MAIRKREPVEQAKIEAFGAAADTPLSDPALSVNAPVPRVTARPSEKATQTAASDLPKTFLIRWGDDVDLALELAEIAKLEDRSQHKTALRALRRGLEVMREEKLS
ncbi:hypothetical protein [Mycetocola saprophilus]|uniref:hypothetical protein n=1 Tax=Mycetocola saprophilus TaxID=76636 RepID=UPI003BF26A0C